MYYRLCFIFVFFVQTIYPQAQEVKVSPIVSDSTKVFITSSDSVKAIKRLLNKTMRVDKDTVRAIAYQRLFLERGITTNDLKIQIYSAYRLGYFYNVLSDYNNAAKYSQVSLQAAITAKDTTHIISSQVLLGSIYFQLGIYDKALAPYQEAQRLSQSTGNAATVLVCLTNIGNIRVKLGRYQDALNVYTETLSLLDTVDDKTTPTYKQTYLSTLLGKGKSQEELGFLDESLTTYEKGIELSKVYNLSIYQGDFYLNIGNVYYKKSQYEVAIDYLQKAKQFLSAYDRDINILITNYYLAQCFYATQAYDKAMQLLQNNFDVIGTNYKTDKIIEMYDLGVKIAVVQGNKDQQLFFLNQSNLLNKLQLENQTKTRDLLFDNDVKTLEDYNKQLDLEKEKQERKKKIAISIAIGMLLLLCISWILYKRKINENERKFQKIIKDLKDVKTTTSVITNDKNEGIQVKDDRAKEIIDKLTTLEASNFFIKLDCNLYNTAKLIDTNTSYLSKALNTYKKQSFNQYLNELRIQYVLIQLNENAKFRAYTLKAISEEIGYKSINTFTKAFKAHTGLTPSYYTKQLATKKDS